MWAQFLGWEGPLEEEMTTHSSTLALGNPMDRGAWQATVHGIEKELDTTWRLNNNIHCGVGKMIAMGTQFISRRYRNMTHRNSGVLNQ